MTEKNSGYMVVLAEGFIQCRLYISQLYCKPLYIRLFLYTALQRVPKKLDGLGSYSTTVLKMKTKLKRKETDYFNRPFRVMELAKYVGVHPSTIRFWVKLGLIPYFKHDESDINAHHLFTVNSLKVAKEVKALRGWGYSLRQIKLGIGKFINKKYKK